MKTLIKDYCNYAKNALGRTEEVVNHHYYNLNQFYEYVAVHKWFLVKIKDVNLKDCLDFLAHYRTTPIQYWPNQWQLPKQNTICEKSKSLRVFFQYVRAIWITWFNREMIPKIQKTRDTIEMRKEEEYQMLRQAPLRYEKKEIFALRNQLMVDIPYTMGLRRSEILRCTFENFQSPNRQFQILGKGWSIEPTFFSEELRTQVMHYQKALKEYTKYRKLKNDFFFIGLDNKNRWKQIDPKYVNFIYTKYSEQLLTEWKIKRKLTTHMGRHSFATNCVFKGVSQQATTKLMRHKDPKTTLRYYHLNNERLRGEFDKLW